MDHIPITEKNQKEISRGLRLNKENLLCPHCRECSFLFYIYGFMCVQGAHYFSFLRQDLVELLRLVSRSWAHVILPTSASPVDAPLCCWFEGIIFHTFGFLR